MTELAASGSHLEALAALAGADHVRPAGPSDAVDDVCPSVVAEPGTGAELAALLAWASAERVPIVLAGGGTRLAWGRTPAPFDVLVRTRRLTRVIHHEPGDLTVSVEAGATLDALNGVLAAHGQWLPLEAPSHESTVGGTLATNNSGPWRHRYGAPRDLLIGIEVATTDGRLVKAGGRVVKNVAGYDLGRLMCGSFGALGAIVSATFKLAPLPAATATLIADFDHAEALAAAAAALAGSQLDAACLEVRVAAGATDAARLQRLLARFGGPAAANQAQISAARLLIASAHPAAQEVATGELEDRLWHEQTRGMWASGGSLVRLSWLPAALPAVAALVEALARERGVAAALAARAALGAGVVRLDGEPAAQAAFVDALRARGDLVSHVVLARADPAVKALVDVWGPAADTLPLLTRVKHTLDPNGILGAGRGII